MGNIERWAAPPLDREDVLEPARIAARDAVRRTLADRASEHLARAKAGETVYGLRLRGPNSHGRHSIPARSGVGGLPGAYSSTWPTLVGGGNGEATIEQARDLAERSPGRFEMVKVDRDELLAVHTRCRWAPLPEDARRSVYALDHATVAEEIVSHYRRQDSPEARNAERRIERLLAAAWAEYRPDALRPQWSDWPTQ